ncbi:MAG: D-alanyl-lipoteichoic acid biosynthesis protein DltB [Oscillospiraceae bacterium]|nr:D-alanyl-lipoteichoic acid biosynthesis protein DltB [Oscillospiraceae bacterium]
MVPFDSLIWFYILIAALIPAAVLGFLGKPIKYYGAVVTFLFLLLIFNTPTKFLYLSLFAVWQLALVKVFPLVLKKINKRPILWLFVLLSLVPMLINKFRVEIGGSVFGILGLSYLSFRAIQVIIDTYDGLIGKIKVFDFLYFILFFPCISSGPIDRSRRFTKELETPYSKEEYRELFEKGVWKLFAGAFYNFVLSNLIYSYWLTPLDKGFLADVSYMYGYTLFLFFNFAGYSLMAIGTAHILGVKLPDNFNMPFAALDMKDFWSRWHISLSTWLRDYVYSRFVMSALKGKWFKNPYTASYIGYVITMMTMGLWHGLETHYIVYGAYHGLLMCVNDILDNKVKGFKKLKRNPKWQPLFCLITIHLFSFGLLIFSGRLF